VQLRLWVLARSVLSNWFAMAANLAVGFFLSPFIVHKLGTVGYGVWVLTVSSMNYLFLLDLGLAGSVVRFVSKAHATGNHEEASRVLAGVLWVRLQIAAAVVALSVGLAYFFPHLFHITGSLASQAQAALVILGISTGVQMCYGTFSSVATALNRYDLRSAASLVQLMVRVGCVVYVLSAGYGMTAIALSEFSAALVSGLIQIIVAHKLYPEVKVRLKKPDWVIMKEVWSYSFYGFLLTIAGQLIYQTDNMVVGAFVSAAAVTFYAIGNSLCRYAQQLVSAMTITFTPAASSLDASGNSERLKSLYFNGTRACMAIYLPVIVTYLTRGKNFIGVWMGPQYAEASSMVLVILSVALLLNLQNSPACSIAWGISKHKTIAKWQLPEAIANLSLSIILAHWFGIYGVAIGTLIPNVVTSQILWPRFVSRMLGISYREVVLGVWAPVYLSAIPFATASYLVGRFAPAHGLLMFMLQTLALLPVFVVSLIYVFRSKMQAYIIPRVRTFLAFAR
jgi:O-antigen/teichoic acid export membrane protein